MLALYCSQKASSKLEKVRTKRLGAERNKIWIPSNWVEACKRISTIGIKLGETTLCPHYASLLVRIRSFDTHDGQTLNTINPHWNKHIHTHTNNNNNNNNKSSCGWWSLVPNDWWLWDRIRWWSRAPIRHGADQAHDMPLCWWSWTRVLMVVMSSNPRPSTSSITC